MEEKGFIKNISYRPLTAAIKYYRTFAFVWFFLMILAIYFLSKLPLFTEHPMLDYAFFLAGLLLFYAAFRAFKKSRFKKMDSMLTDNCDPESYKKAYTKLLRSLSNTDHSSEQGGYEVNLGFELYWLNICEGIIASGDFEGAMRILSSFRFYGRDRAERLYNVICESCLSSVCLSLGETDRAAAHLARLKNILERNKFKKTEIEQYGRFGDMLRFRINMARGSYEYAEDFFTGMFLTAKNKYERVQARFYLGEVFLHNGDSERARQAFDYVIAEGNKLHIVEEAKERLKRLS